MEQVYAFTVEIELGRYEVALVKSIRSEPIYQNTSYAVNNIDSIDELITKGLIYIDEDFWYRVTEVGELVASAST